VGLGVPTLVVTENDSAAADEGRRIGAMIVESGDLAGMRTILDDLVDGRSGHHHPKVPVSYESLAVQMDEILRVARTAEIDDSPKTAVWSRLRRRR